MRAFVLISALLITACAQPVPTSYDMADVNAAASRAQDDVDTYAANDAMAAAAPTPAPLTPADPGQPGGLPDDRTPISGAPLAPDSAQGAANVVQTYYALIGEGKYRQAWALWGDGRAVSGLSANGFAASFAKYSEYHANVGAPGRVDAGAGQRYVTVPVQAYARLKSGGAADWIGSIVLHRTAAIDGATAEDKSWRIKSIDLKSAPPSAK